MGEVYVSMATQASDFLGADLPAKSAMVEHLAKSWDLASSNSAEPPKVTEKQVAIVEVGLRWYLPRILLYIFTSNVTFVFQAFARALKAVRSTLSIFILERQICDLKDSMPYYDRPSGLHLRLA